MDCIQSHHNNTSPTARPPCSRPATKSFTRSAHQVRDIVRSRGPPTKIQELNPKWAPRPILAQNCNKPSGKPSICLPEYLESFFVFFVGSAPARMSPKWAPRPILAQNCNKPSGKPSICLPEYLESLWSVFLVRRQPHPVSAEAPKNIRF